MPDNNIDQNDFDDDDDFDDEDDDDDDDDYDDSVSKEGEPRQQVDGIELFMQELSGCRDRKFTSENERDLWLKLLEYSVKSYNAAAHLGNETSDEDEIDAADEEEQQLHLGTAAP